LLDGFRTLPSGGEIQVQILQADAVKDSQTFDLRMAPQTKAYNVEGCGNQQLNRGGGAYGNNVRLQRQNLE